MKKISYLLAFTICWASCKKDDKPQYTLDKIVGYYDVTKTYTFKETDIRNNVVVKDTSFTHSENIEIEIARGSSPETFVYNNKVYHPDSSLTGRSDPLTFGWQDTVDGFYSKRRFYFSEGKFIDEQGWYKKEVSPEKYVEGYGGWTVVGIKRK